MNASLLNLQYLKSAIKSFNGIDERVSLEYHVTFSLSQTCILAFNGN